MSAKEERNKKVEVLCKRVIVMVNSRLYAC